MFGSSSLCQVLKTETLHYNKTIAREIDSVWELILRSEHLYSENPSFQLCSSKAQLTKGAFNGLCARKMKSPRTLSFRMVTVSLVNVYFCEVQ